MSKIKKFSPIGFSFLLSNLQLSTLGRISAIFVFFAVNWIRDFNHKERENTEKPHCWRRPPQGHDPKVSQNEWRVGAWCLTATSFSGSRKGTALALPSGTLVFRQRVC